VYKASGEIENFEQMLRNIFAPLFEVTRDPSSNVPLAVFLETVRDRASLYVPLPLLLSLSPTPRLA
jgi:hypothetical protein